MARGERAVLRVEGKDDKYVTENLLSRHGTDRTVVDIRWSKRGDHDGGRDRLLEGLRLAVTTSTGRAVGFCRERLCRPRSGLPGPCGRVADAGQQAVLHPWLAWQQRPGLPHGLAITSRYFRHDSPVALIFVEWFRRVFAPTSIWAAGAPPREPTRHGPQLEN